MSVEVHFLLSLTPEPELFNGYNPEKKTFYQEVQLNHDLEPVEISAEDAARFKREQGANVDVWAQESGEWFAKFRDSLLDRCPMDGMPGDSVSPMTSLRRPTGKSSDKEQ